MKFEDFRILKQQIITEAYAKTSEKITSLLAELCNDNYASIDYYFHLADIILLICKYNSFCEYLDELDIDM